MSEEMATTAMSSVPVTIASTMPGTLSRERPKPRIGPFLDRIADILESDKQIPKKQRHTAKRIYERIKEEGYQGKYTQVKEAVSRT